MPKSDDVIDRAFISALEKEQDFNSCASDHIELLDQGVDHALPNLCQFTIHHEDEQMTGQKFNQYKIIKKIGAGGMGDVYLAQRIDGQYEKKVAIKILTHGYLSNDIKDRFLREKHILAALRHPSIVPLVDAGTTEDQIPWFALEYIDGLPIHHFCEKKSLSTEARVRLMLKVCDAVQFAHSQGIIHRDLKPANLLVESIDGDFNPVVLDFGIAHKNDQHDLTSQGHIIGTPNYMSPEQIKGDQSQADRRSDVFSLGVVLYRLLVNQLPFEAEDTIDLYKKILHDKAAPITVNAFPKDLKTIIHTCLRKQAINRYQSVNELKDDLNSWLSGFPIKAQKEKLRAKTWLWFKRNKLLSVSLAFMISVSVLAFIKYAYDINHERQLALESKLESDELLNFMLDDLHQQLTEIGRVDVLETVAVRSLSHLNKYRRIISSDQYIKQAIIYRNLADVLTMQSDHSNSLSALVNAQGLLLPLIDHPEQGQQALIELSLSKVDLANLYAKLGQLQKSSSEFELALQYAYQLNPLNNESSQSVQWQVHNAYAWNLMEENRYEEAEEHLNTALKMTEERLNISSEDTKWQKKKLSTLTTFGWFYNEKRSLESSKKVYLSALELAQKLYKKLPDSTSTINGLQRVLNQLAYTYSVDNQYKEALIYAEQAKTVGIALHNKAPENKIYYRALAYTYTTLGDGYKNLGDIDAAAEHFAAGLKITEHLASNAPGNASLQNDLAIDNMNLGQLLLDKGQVSMGHDHWEKAERAIESFARAPDASVYYVDTYVTVLLMQNKIKQARPYLQILKNSEGWGHQAYQILVDKYQVRINDEG